MTTGEHITRLETPAWDDPMRREAAAAEIQAVRQRVGGRALQASEILKIDLEYTAQVARKQQIARQQFEAEIHQQ